MSERRGRSGATDETMRSDETGATGPRPVGSRPSIPPGTRFEGVYEVKRLLGAGAMGMVYLVEHLGLQKEFALKIVDGTHGLDVDALTRLKNEARITSAVQHDNIVSLTHMGQTGDGNLFLVMELLRGEDLADRLARQRVAADAHGGSPWLPDAEVSAIVEPILSALSAAHAAGVIHRDLKPGNVFLAQTPTGMRPKLVDFGIGKIRGKPGTEIGSTAPGAIIGTPLYMAPEQARSSREVDGRADLYALGVVVFEMMCGRAPFVGKNVLELVVLQATAPPPDPRALRPDLPAPIVEWILRALAKEPEGRWENAGEMLAAWLAAWGEVRHAATSPATADVLVIDDEDDIRDNVREILEAEGHAVRTAANGPDGVRLARERRPDLVLCDVTLPGLDGFGVLSALAADARTEGVPFVFVSGVSERPAIRRGMNLGADDYLTKPFGRAELLETVRSRLAVHHRRRPSRS